MTGQGCKGWLVFTGGYALAAIKAWLPVRTTFAAPFRVGRHRSIERPDVHSSGGCQAVAEARGLDPAEWRPHLLRHACGTGRMMQTYRAAHSRTRGKNMKCETWIHTALHIGCAALLVLQGHRILQLQTNWREDSEYLRGLVVHEAGSAAQERMRQADCIRALNSCRQHKGKTAHVRK
jgi:hypothetical protein